MAGKGNANKAAIDEALAFTQIVKNTFQNEHEKYDEFVDIMKNYKAHGIDISTAVTRLKEVFKGHQELILGFGVFLPSGYNKTTLERKERKPVSFKDAYSFITKVKKRCTGNNVRVYESFKQNLEMYESGSKPIIDVCHQFGILFWDHPDLLVDLNFFLPPSSKGPIREGGIAMLFQSLQL